METQIIHGDCLEELPDIETDSIDCIVTDPPYGMSFMGKNWDRAVPSVAIWKECLRVLKPGAFGFVMCIPRQDSLAHMIVNLGDAGFNVAFSSIYWTYASGFPKAQNLSKIVDKRACVEREVICESNRHGGGSSNIFPERGNAPITAPATDQAKALDGAYGGFQPKPAVEVIIVAMKPLSEKTYVDQAMANMHGCTWLDDCRIPYESNDFEKAKKKNDSFSTANNPESATFKGVGSGDINNKGRFPANVLCEDDVLDDGTIRKTHHNKKEFSQTYHRGESVYMSNAKVDIREDNIYFDEGGFSRYFSLDAWFAERIKLLPKEAQKTFPWLIVPKASKSEKNRGLVGMSNKKGVDIMASAEWQKERGRNPESYKGNKNNHPTCKPIKLMSWLITFGTREGDIVLDPFVGSGTTCIAAKILGRRYVGIEREEEYVEIARKRLSAIPTNLDEWTQK